MSEGRRAETADADDRPSCVVAARARYIDHANIAESYVALGEKSSAFSALEQAYNGRSQLFELVRSVSEFKPLHHDARYRTLMEKSCAGLNAGGVAN